MVVNVNIRIKQRTPGEVVAYHDGWQAGFKEALKRMRRAVNEVEEFGSQAETLQQQLEGVEARVPFPTPIDGGK